MNLEEYKKVDTYFKDKVLKIQEAGELEVLNSLIKAASETISATQTKNFINKVFIVMDLKSNKFKPSIIPLNIEEYLANNDIIKKIIKEYNSSNTTTKIVGVPIMFFGAGGTINVKKYPEEVQEKLFELHKKIDALSKIKEIKSLLNTMKNNFEDDLEEEMYNNSSINVEDELKEAIEELSKLTGIPKASLNIKYNKYSSVSFLNYGVIESEDGSICTSEQPINIQINKFEDFSASRVTTSLSESSQIFGSPEFNFFK